jgi:putative redox protein
VSPSTSTVRVACVEGRGFATLLTVRNHELISDEPIGKGGDDLGPSPMTLALLALGACASITMEMYAGRVGWPLDGVEIEVVHEVIETPAGKHDRIERQITLRGDLGTEARQRLLAIAGRWPVSRL